MKDLLFDRRRADSLLVDCEYCGQPVGQLCTDLRSGEEIQHQPAHFKRITAAGKEQVAP